MAASSAALAELIPDEKARVVTVQREISTYRPHRFVGGKPPLRLYRMQIAHESRARKLGVDCHAIDLRHVYRLANGVCGICGQLVGFNEFTIDHIRPLSKGGHHVLSNLQLAHVSCNSRKGDRYDGDTSV